LRSSIIRSFHATQTVHFIVSQTLRYSDHVRGKGKALFQLASKRKLEGIVAKKSDSPYQFRRSRSWLKIKTKMRQEVVIGGYTQPQRSRVGFGALLVGVYEKGRLVFVGHVGTGFSHHQLKEIHQQMKKLIIFHCPFMQEPPANATVTWVKPRLVCEVSFAEWTREKIMRQPVFKGMRIDKHPKEAIREIPKMINGSANR